MTSGIGISANLSKRRVMNGRSPTTARGFGRSATTDRNRVPSPPARIAAVTSMGWIRSFRRVGRVFEAHREHGGPRRLDPPYGTITSARILEGRPALHAIALDQFPDAVVQGPARNKPSFTQPAVGDDVIALVRVL